MRGPCRLVLEQEDPPQRFAEVAEYGVVLYKGAAGGGDAGPGILAGVPRDNTELAGKQAESAVRSIGGIESEIAGVPIQEAEAAAGEHGDAAEVRMLRYARILEASHMVLEQCFRAVSSAVDGRSLGRAATRLEARPRSPEDLERGPAGGTHGQ